MAWNNLVNAEAELNRPNEDVVTLSACRSVRTAMNHMMGVYLVAHGLEYRPTASLQELADKCATANPAFSNKDMSHIACKGMGHDECDGKYCLSVASVSDCLSAASQLKDIVSFELQVK